MRASCVNSSGGTHQERAPDPVLGLEENGGVSELMSRVGRCGKAFLWAQEGLAWSQPFVSTRRLCVLPLEGVSVYGQPGSEGDVQSPCGEWDWQEEQPHCTPPQGARSDRPFSTFPPSPTCVLSPFLNLCCSFLFLAPPFHLISLSPTAPEWSCGSMDGACVHTSHVLPHLPAPL